MVLACVLISYQDFRTKYIHAGTLLMLALGVMLFYHRNITMSLYYVLINLFFLIFLFFSLYLYLAIRHNVRKGFVDRYIGLGDIIALCIFCVSYNLYNYVIFILLSSLFALLLWALNFLLTNKKIVRIPLAGCMALVHLTISLLCFFVPYDPIRNFVL